MFTFNLHLFVPISWCNLPSTLTIFLLVFFHGFCWLKRWNTQTIHGKNSPKPVETLVIFSKKYSYVFFRLHGEGSRFKASQRNGRTRRTLWHLGLPSTFLSVMATVSCALAVSTVGDPSIVEKDTNQVELWAGWYCWWFRNPKVNHCLDVSKPVNTGVFTISTGAGFLPSTVVITGSHMFLTIHNCF